jgi:predicted dehydrogenase
MASLPKVLFEEHLRSDIQKASLIRSVSLRARSLGEACRSQLLSMSTPHFWQYAREPYAIKLPVIPHTDRAGALQAFVQAVQTGEEPECSGRNNLGAVSLMIAAIESATSHRPILMTTD